MAEQAGLSGVSAENQQIALRFRGGEPPPELPNLGAHVRVGRTALWFPYSQHADWQVILIDLLHKLSAHKHKLDERVKLTK